MLNSNEFFNLYWSMQKKAQSPGYLDQLPWNAFIQLVSTMNIRTGGVAIESRVIAKNNWKKVRGHESAGDALDDDGKVVEIKSTIITPNPGSSVSFKGIRPWHNVDYHYFIVVDLSDIESEPITNSFKLDRVQIDKEVTSGTLRPYSGKKIDRLEHAHHQLGASFKKGDLGRWIDSYSTSIKL